MPSYHEQLRRLTDDYCFPDRPYAEVFMDLLEAAVREADQPTVLDIGCGSGIFRNPDHQERIRPHITHFIGVEPDPNATSRPGLFDETHHCLMEDSPIPPGTVDLAYAAMVVEHVQNPSAFLAAVAGCLKPGGRFLFCTPNASSYFGIICRAAHRVGIDEWLLRRVRKKEHVESYHFPIAYRMNRAADIVREAEAVGLTAKVGFTESEKACAGYFPKPAKPILRFLKNKRKRKKEPAVLTQIIAEVSKPLSSE